MADSGMTWRIVEGDCRDVLRTMPAQSVHTVVTSPPYFGLRDYGTGEWEGGDPECDHVKAKLRTAQPHTGDIRRRVEGEQTYSTQKITFGDVCGKCGARRTDRQIGREPTPDEFVAALVEVFREVRRVLRDDGTVWINLGDSYQSNPGSGYANGDLGGLAGRNSEKHKATMKAGHATKNVPRGSGKPKDLLGIPWLCAFALRADGWYLRSDIIWSKPNPMPESVTDRPTKAHEYVFLLSKGPRYFYDADAIREPHDTAATDPRRRVSTEQYEAAKIGSFHDHESDREQGQMQAKVNGFAALGNPAGRNKRSVWTVATQPYAGAHFATFPPKLIEPCILAGAPERACGECGAPWVRVVERRYENVAMKDTASKPRNLGQQQDRDGRLYVANNGNQKPTPRVETLGFEPSCPHGDGSATGVVLDPFAGAGTTGMVALQHGREFVGIELSPEYARMARERIETAVRLGFRSPQNGQAQIDGQLDIFGAMP